MTFRKWLKENYADSNCPLGDLYQDMKREDRLRHKYPDKYPHYALWKNNHKWILNHLRSLHACEEAIATFKEAWAEYKNDVKIGFAK